MGDPTGTERQKQGRQTETGETDRDRQTGTETGETSRQRQRDGTETSPTAAAERASLRQKEPRQPARRPRGPPGNEAWREARGWSVEAAGHGRAGTGPKGYPSLGRWRRSKRPAPGAAPQGRVVSCLIVSCPARKSRPGFGAPKSGETKPAASPC